MFRYLPPFLLNSLNSFVFYQETPMFYKYDMFPDFFSNPYDNLSGFFYVTDFF